jgi:hypothetical protein
MTNVIRMAAERLPGHWCKGAYHDNNGNACIVGHLSDVYNEANFKEWNKASNLLKETLIEFTNGKYEHIPQFNDADETTEADAVAFLEKAAVRFDERVDLTD